jgi:Lon protease-like protein
MAPQWQAMLDVLQSLEIHPHVQRLAMQVDHGDAWQVAWSLAQLLPLDESLKYQWLGLDDAGLLLAQLDRVLNQISGEE